MYSSKQIIILLSYLIVLVVFTEILNFRYLHLMQIDGF